MKNKMTRNVILMAVVTVIMAVALSLYIQNTGTVPAARQRRQPDRWYLYVQRAGLPE